MDTTRDRAAHASRMLNYFTLPGVGEADGMHICYVQELYPTDLQSVINAMGRKPLPLRVAKRVLKDVLLGLEHLHELGIAHTGMYIRVLFAALLAHRRTGTNRPETQQYYGQSRDAVETDRRH